MREKKLYINYVVFILLSVLGIAMLVTGLILWASPKGGHYCGYVTVLGVTKAKLKRFHFYMGIALTVLTTIHIALNWNWVVKATNIVLGKSLQRR